MAKLTPEQEKQLEELTALREAPDEPANGSGVGRVLNITLDIGDDAQMKRAFALGLLEEPKPVELPADGEGGEGGEGGDGEGGEGEGPRRRGFFD